MKQESFSNMEYRCRKKKTKREEFLEIMDEIIPTGKRGRPPVEIETMLRMYLLQCWFNLSDEGVEDDEVVYGDSACLGLEKRDEIKQAPSAPQWIST